MREMTDFERLLSQQLQEYVRAADGPFTPASIARHAISDGRGRRTGYLSWPLSPRLRLVWMLAVLMLTLALGAAVATLMAPSGHQRLVFVRDGAVYLGSTADSSPTRIADGGEVDRGLAGTIRWAPDGGSVAALRATRVEVLSPTGSVVAVFDSDGRFGDPAAISWAPDSAHLAVAVRNGVAELSLWLLDVGAETSIPVELPQGFESFYPAVAWSPQGDWIALNGCVCVGGKAPGLWVVAADGSGVHEVTSAEGGSAWGPVWSPDGTRIAFSRQPAQCATCDETLWVANIGDESVTLIADLLGSERGIAWSPEGLLIAVTSLQITGTAIASQPDQRSALIVVAADGGGSPVTLASGGIKIATGAVSGEWMETGEVAWSSDGERLLYLSSAQDEYPSASIREVAAAGGRTRIVLPNVEAFDVGDEG